MFLARRSRWMVTVIAVGAVAVATTTGAVAGPATPALPRTVSAPRGGSTAWPGPSPAGSDWPQFMRGSYHQGWNQAETALSPTTVSRLGPVWADEIGSTHDAPNSGSPIVVGNAVYIGGPDVSRRNASTGAVVWSTNIAAAGSVSSVLTTPAYDHGIVVAATSWSRSRDTLTALNATTGAVLWKRRLPGLVSSSPSTLNGVVYVGIGDNEVMAVRLTTGSVAWAWKTAISNYGLVSSPTTDGKGVYFSTDGGTHVWALNAATGTQRWALALDSGNGYTVDGLSVSVLAGRVYAGNVAGFVYSINAATGAIVWRVDVGGPVWRAVIAMPQAILTLPEEANNDEDQVTALSPADGHVLWNYKVAGDVSTGLATANGVVYLGWSNGTLSQLDAIGLSAGTELARIALPAPAGPDPTAYSPEPPAISGGRVYLARWQELFALALSSGSTGTLPASATSTARPRIAVTAPQTHPVSTRAAASTADRRSLG